MMRAFALLVLVAMMAFGQATEAAVSPDEILENPQQEARARALAKELRCLVCQNQSIDDSDAPLATDLRRVVREQIVAGASDTEIKDYLVARYGDFVLLSPPVNSATYALWIGPFILLAVGALVIVGFVRRNRRIPVGPKSSLSQAERDELQSLLKNKDA